MIKMQFFEFLYTKSYTDTYKKICNVLGSSIFVIPLFQLR